MITGGASTAHLWRPFARFPTPASGLSEAPQAEIGANEQVSACGASSSQGADAASLECPFVGLRPFDYADHPFFFGRDAHVRVLYRLLDQGRFVAVVGGSGGGKSSLVRAGLRALLAWETAEAAGTHWRWAELKPGEAPLLNLARAVGALDPPPPGAPDPGLLAHAHAERIEALLRRSSRGLVTVLQQLPVLAGSTLVLLVDQFEELFRYAELRALAPTDAARRELRRDEATAFVQLLLAAAEDRGGVGLRVLVTMRTDFLGDCARFESLAEAVSAAQFLLPRLARDELQEIIVKPVAAAGAAIDPPLVQELLNDASGDPDQLPVLQHSLMRIWRSAQARACSGGTLRPELGADDYHGTGRLAGALSAHADEIMAEFAKRHGGEMAAVVETIFRSLTTLEAEGRAVRRPQTFARLRDVLVPTGLDAPARAIAEDRLRQALDRFRQPDCSFLVPPIKAGPLADGDIVDIAHEALIRRWGKLAGAGEKPGWLREEARDARRYQALLELLPGPIAPDATPQWEAWWGERTRTPGWAQMYGGRFPEVGTLIQSSVENLRRQEARERAQAALEERERRLRQQLATQRRRFLTFAGAAIGAVAMVGLAAWLVYGLYEEAEQARAVADARRAELEQALATAQGALASLPSAPAPAPSEPTAAETMPPPPIAPPGGDGIVISGNVLLPAAKDGRGSTLQRAIEGLADQAREATAAAGRERALLLAKQARDGVDTVGATVALLLAREGLAGRDDLPYVPDAEAAAYAALQQLRQLRIIEGTAFLAYRADISPDGTRVAVPLEGGTVAIIATGSGEKLVKLALAGEALSVGFDPTGSRVVTTSIDETAKIWSAMDGKLVGTLEHANAQAVGALFAPDGDRVLTAWSLLPGVRGPENVWASIFVAGSRTPVRTFDTKGNELYVAFDPTGRKIATGGDKETVVWDASSGERLWVFPNDGETVIGVAFSPDGRLLATAGDGTVIVRDLDQEGREVLRQAQSGGAYSVVFSPSGDRLIIGGDSMIRIWDIATGRLVAVLRDQDGVITAPAVSQTGELLVSISSDSTARIWRLRPELAPSFETGLSPIVRSGRRGEAVAASERDIVLRPGSGAGLELVAERANASGDHEGGIRISLPPDASGTAAAAAASFFPNHRRVVVAPERGPLLVYDLGDLGGPVLRWGGGDDRWAGLQVTTDSVTNGFPSTGETVPTIIVEASAADGRRVRLPVFADRATLLEFIDANLPRRRNEPVTLNRDQRCEYRLLPATECGSPATATAQ